MPKLQHPNGAITYYKLIVVSLPSGLISDILYSTIYFKNLHMAYVFSLVDIGYSTETYVCSFIDAVCLTRIIPNDVPIY